MSTQLPMSMEHHPDILELREHAERVTATPLAQGVETLAVLAGLFCAISPWVVGFTGFSALTVNNLVLGLAFTVLMGGFGSAFERTHARAWAASLIGVWMIIAPWATVGDEAIRRTILTNCITGGLMTCLGLAAVAMVLAGPGMRLGKRGG
ncbi:SPW repeat protein [Kitasatospora atroaurantiaca]|uniref:SPW repeat-containing protein n=1 Tax=Kitasatospora atroaurantiaca TaxID=285545 RepID=A0A561EY40_9ACTN|nr:SPW repeat protein [Kitasatospora atroaurantiaca]TWE20523.1 SPW repeat-containing protein [Kitasatospora atroaurantiaca]